MNFLCQQAALADLKTLADNNTHSVLLLGPSGSGKTYLAHEYCKMLGIEDFITVPSTVSEIRQTIDECYRIHNKVLVCVENLDKGVFGASSAMLKFLEEPVSHVYIVVTGTNYNRIADTIISRSAVVTTAPPLPADINSYSEDHDYARYQVVSKSNLWKAVRSFKDAEYVMNISGERLQYFESLDSMWKASETVANLTWKLGHFDDNSETPISLVIQYIVANSEDAHIRKSGLECLSDLDSSHIATHAILSRFVFECKYVEE